MDSNVCTQLALDLFGLPPGEPAAAPSLTARDGARAWAPAAEVPSDDRTMALGALAEGLARSAADPLSCVVANLRFVSEELGPLVDAVQAGAPSAGAARAELEAALAEARAEAERLVSLVRDLRDFTADEALADGAERCSLDEALTDALGVAAGRLQPTAWLERRDEHLPPVAGGHGRVSRALALLLGALLRRVPPGQGAAHCLRVEARAAGASVHLRLCLSREAGGLPPGLAAARDASAGAGSPAAFSPVSWLEPRPALGGAAGAIVRWVEDAPRPAHAGRQADERPASPVEPSDGGRAVVLARGLLAPVGSELAWTALPGGGAAVSVRLRLAGVRPLAPRVPRHGCAPSARRSVLVVDPDAAVQAALRRELGAWAYVEGAASAREAIAALAAGRRFDALLCELMLPDMPGWSLQDVVREHWADQAERMLFLTGGPLGDEAVSFLGRTPHARVDKPFERESIFAALAKLDGLGGLAGLGGASRAPHSPTSLA